MTTTLEAALARARREGAEAERSRVARLLERLARAHDTRGAVALRLAAQRVRRLRALRGSP